MYSGSDKNTGATFLPVDGQNPYLWCRPAALATAIAAFAGLFGVAWLAKHVGELPRLAELWLGLLPLHTIGLLVCLVILARHYPRRQWLRGLNLSAINARAIVSWLGKSGLIVAVFYPVNLLVTGITVTVLKWLDVEPQLSPVIRYLLDDVSAPVVLSVGIAAVIVAPLAEEILFRLVVYEALNTTEMIAPATTTALIFAVVHAAPTQIPAIFVLGLVLQRARRHAGTLWLPMIIHSLFNMTSLVLALVWEQQAG